MLLLTRPHLQTTSLPQSQECKVIKITFAIVSSLEYSRLKILVFFLDLIKKKFSFVISFALEADTCLPLSIIFCHCSSSSGKLFFQGSRQGYKENIPYGCRYKTSVSWLVQLKCFITPALCLWYTTFICICKNEWIIVFILSSGLRSIIALMFTNIFCESIWIKLRKVQFKDKL